MVIEHTDHTETERFEQARQNIIPIEPWQCPYCLKRLGDLKRKSAAIKIITAQGLDIWCQECVEKGIEEGICIKYRKLDKKERRRLMENPPKCLNCGQPLIPVKDPIQGKFTGYLWRCACMNKNLIISIG